jgi:hypothetical protein
MTTGASREFKAEAILSKLAEADEAARLHGDTLKGKVGHWVERIDYLCTMPLVTYLPVLCVLITARALRGPDELDVLALKTSSSEKGYSAASIGKRLIPFAGQCGIDLRSKSTQVMNSQPFTYKVFITPEMAGDQYAVPYSKFYEDALLVQEMTSDEALTLLAYVFHTRRGIGQSDTKALTLQGGKKTFDRLVEVTIDFVESNSEQGKVGQAFAAALYDTLYDAEQVRMGNNNDPSFGAPGDVQVGPETDYWLWGEVKQKNIVTQDVKDFMDKVHAVGGERISYFALVNHRYPGQLNESQLQKVAARIDLDLTIYTSPEDALHDLLDRAPGSFQQVASDFATRFTARLQEAQVTSSLEEAWTALLEQFT